LDEGREKERVFASEATPAVCKGRASEVPESRLSNRGLWILKELDGEHRSGGVWIQELHRCRREAGSALCVEKVSFFLYASLQVLPLLS